MKSKDFRKLDRPKKVSGSGQFFRLDDEDKKEFEELCWEERVTVAAKLRELVRGEIDRKKVIASKTITNIEYGDFNKLNYPERFPSLDKYFHFAEGLEDLNELEKLKTMAWHLQEQYRTLMQIIVKRHKELTGQYYS